MQTFVIFTLIALYLITIPVIGRRIARLSWDAWEDRQSEGLSWVLFPLHTLTRCVGEDYFGLSHPFTPIVMCHGEYSGNGFGVLKASPKARGKYFLLTSVAWLPKMAVNATILTLIGIPRILTALIRCINRIPIHTTMAIR